MNVAVGYLLWVTVTWTVLLPGWPVKKEQRIAGFGVYAPTYEACRETQENVEHFGPLVAGIGGLRKPTVTTSACEPVEIDLVSTEAE